MRKGQTKTQHQKLDELKDTVHNVEVDVATVKAKLEMVIKFQWMLVGVIVISNLENIVTLATNHIPHLITYLISKVGG